MDKRGDPVYIRLPLSMEARIEELCNQEGRGKNEMIIILIARGLHDFKFHIKDYATFNHDEQQK